MRNRDTTPKMEEFQIKIFRKMPPESRLNLALQLSEIERELLMEGIRRRHRKYQEKEVELALKRIILGDELFEKVYPDSKHIKP